MSNRIGGGFRGTSYQGTIAQQPPECFFEQRDPTQYDTNGYSLLDLWLNELTETPWILVSLQGNSTSKGQLATWITFAGGGSGITMVPCNVGTAVPAAGILSILGASDGSGNTGVRTTGSGSTVTIDTTQITTLTNSGSASPSGDNLFIIGTGNIATSGIGSTVTIAFNGAVAEQYTADDSNVAVPNMGNLDLLGTNLVTSTAAGDAVTYGLTHSTNGKIPIARTSDGTAAWANITAGTGISVTNGANSITIASSAASAQYTTNSGVATPVAGNLNVLGTNLITTTGSGQTVTAKLTPSTNGQIPIGNTGTGLAAWNTITAGSNVTVTNGPGTVTIAASTGSPGALVLLETKTMTSEFSINFSLSPLYNTYKLMFWNVLTDGVATGVQARYSIDGGATQFLPGSLSGNFLYWLSSTTTPINGSAPYTLATHLYLPNIPTAGEFTFFGLEKTGFTFVQAQGLFSSYNTQGWSQYDAQGPDSPDVINALIIRANAGTISGVFSLYGLVQ